MLNLFKLAQKFGPVVLDKKSLSFSYIYIGKLTPAPGGHGFQQTIIYFSNLGSGSSKDNSSW